MSERTREPHRHYSEQEVEDILRRASGLERRKQLERPQLTLQEIEAVAKEAGLDPQLVRRAASELEEQRKAALSTRLAGAPLRRTFERVIDGELTAAAHERLAAEILEAVRGLSPMATQLNAIGRTLSWSGWTQGGSIALTVTPRDGQTVIRVDVNSSQLAGGLYGGIIGGVGGGLGTNVAWMLPRLLHLPVAAGIAGALGVVLGAYGLARWLYTWRAGAVHDAMEKLADQLEARVKESLKG